MALPREFARGLLLVFALIAPLSAPVVFTFMMADAARPPQSDAAAGQISLTAVAGSTPEYAGAPKLARPQAASVQQAVAGDIVISEFRFRGTGTGPDEFIELFNRNCAQAINLKDWTVRSADGSGSSELYKFTVDTFLAPSQYYLLAAVPGFDDGISPDAAYPPGVVDEGGAALFLPDGVTIIDQVGLSGDSVYVEGTALEALTDSIDQGYRRKKAPSGMLVDTNNNLADFTGPVASAPHTASDFGTCGNPTPTPTVPPPTPTVACNLTPAPTSYAALAVLINEVGWSGTLASTGDEWIELYNTNTLCPVDLEDWHLIAVRSGGTIAFDIAFDSSDDIPAGDYFVIATDPNVFQNVPIDRDLSDRPVAAGGAFGLIDTGMILYLRGPDDELVDTANFGTSTVNVNSWPAGSTSGRRSMERYRTLPDTRTNWVTFLGSTAFASWPLDDDGNRVNGTPGRANWAFSVTVTPRPVPTKGRTPTPIPPTPFGRMVINEFLPRAGTDWNQDEAVNVYDEFIELKNLGPVEVDLQNWKLDDVAGQGSPMFTLPSFKLKPGERAVFYGLATGILLEDSGDTVRLINPQGIVIDARGYDVVEHADESHCRIPDGYYWRLACFATPGNENALTGEAPAPSPIVLGGRPPCLLPDTVPEPFRQAECDGFGDDMWDRTYWDGTGFAEFPIVNAQTKWKTIAE